MAVGDPHLATDPTTATRWHLTIHETIRIALGNAEAVRNLGLVEARSDVDIVRALMTTYDPQIADALAAAEWGIFDPLWTTAMQWDRIDIPPGTSFSGIGNRPPELDTADFYTSLEQLLPGGTRLRADYVTDYLFNPNHPPTLDPNPQYFSYAEFGLSQPLMQGLGVNVTMAPIRIAAAEAERTDWQFKQEMLALVRSIETAYWTLYAEQRNLQAIDQALPFFREIVRVREEQARGPAGTESEAARALSEMLLYEQRRLDALSNIAEQQLVLRNLMGLPPNDGRYLALVALPVTSPPFQTVGDAIMTAVNQRPDVLRQRLAVYVAQQDRIIGRDALRPQLDFNAFWRINGLGEDLPESWDVLGQNDFHDWQLGVRLQVPLGRRQARANLRAAELTIQKERALLEQSAHQAAFEVADAYRRIIWLNQQHRVSSDRVSALIQWRQGAKAQFENPPSGVSTVLALEMYLNNLRDFVEASIKANSILADYNSALARLEEVKGTLLETRLVEVMGDPTDEVPEELPTPQIQLPEWMSPSPAEMERRRTEPGANGSAPAAPARAPAVRPGPAFAEPARVNVPDMPVSVIPSTAPRLEIGAPQIPSATLEQSAKSANADSQRRGLLDFLNYDVNDPPATPLDSNWPQMQTGNSQPRSASEPAAAAAPIAAVPSTPRQWETLPQGRKAIERPEHGSARQMASHLPPITATPRKVVSESPVVAGPRSQPLTSTTRDAKLSSPPGAAYPREQTPQVVLKPSVLPRSVPPTGLSCDATNRAGLAVASRVELRILNPVTTAPPHEESSNVVSMRSSKGDSRSSFNLDEMYEDSGMKSEVTLSQQHSQQFGDAEIEAPLANLEQFYSANVLTPSPRMSRYLAPSDDICRPEATTRGLPIGDSIVSLRNPEEERVATATSIRQLDLPRPSDPLLEPDTLYFDGPKLAYRLNSETWELPHLSTESDHHVGDSMPRATHFSPASGPGAPAKSTSESVPGPLDSLYDAATTRPSGPESLTAGSFASEIDVSLQSSFTSPNRSKPRALLGSVISRPEEAASVPEEDRQPPRVAFRSHSPDQMDTPGKAGKAESHHGQLLVSPTVYGAEAIYRN